MTIRTAKIDEISMISAIAESIPEFKVSGEAVNFWPEEVILQIIESKYDELLLAEENDEILGFIVCNFNPNFGKAIIENLYVMEEYRGKGIADKLRDQLIVRLRQNGCEYLCTFVESGSDKAIESYQRYGFDRGIDCVWLDIILEDSFRE